MTVSEALKQGKKFEISNNDHEDVQYLCSFNHPFSVIKHILKGENKTGEFMSFVDDHGQGYLWNGTQNNSTSIRPKKEKRTVWVNVYQKSGTKDIITSRETFNAIDKAYIYADESMDARKYLGAFPVEVEI